jgi:hypothetical protein
LVRNQEVEGSTKELWVKEKENTGMYIKDDKIEKEREIIINCDNQQTWLE